MAKRGAARNARASGASPQRSRRLEAVDGNRALKLDRVIHERARLAIVSALAASGELTFSELKDLLRVTDGNLSVHCRRLEDAGYVVCEKTFEKRVPKSSYRLSAQGKRALERYLQHMEALIQVARENPS